MFLRTGGIAEQKPVLAAVGTAKGHSLLGRRSGESQHASLDRRRPVAQLEGEEGGAAVVHQRSHRLGSVAEKQDRGQCPQYAANRGPTRLAKGQTDSTRGKRTDPAGQRGRIQT